MTRIVGIASAMLAGRLHGCTCVLDHPDSRIGYVVVAL